MASWFMETFGAIVAEARHEVMGGWFGRTFEPHPNHPATHPPAEREPAGRDVQSDMAGFYGHDHER